jgi:hypothetical protein
VLCGDVVVGALRRVRCRGVGELHFHQEVGDGEAGMVARSEGSRWSGASAIARRSFGRRTVVSGSNRSRLGFRKRQEKRERRLAGGVYREGDV